METEKKLRDEQAKRVEAEDKFFALVQRTQHSTQVKHVGDQAPSGNSEIELLELANEELRRKDLEVKKLRHKVEMYEGKNLEKKNIQEMKDSFKVMGEGYRKLQSAIDSQSRRQ